MLLREDAVSVKWSSVMEVWDMEEGEEVNIQCLFMLFICSPDENGETTLDAMIMDG